MPDPQIMAIMGWTESNHKDILGILSKYCLLILHDY